MPDFAAFGLSQYFLYIRPLKFDKIDVKLLLSNSFQKFESTTSIDGFPLLFIKYLFPLETPNKTYLNRMRRDNHLSEYCLFRTKKVYNILHFDKNLSIDGWDTDTKIYEFFKIHAQRILFGSSRDIKDLNIKEFSLSEIKDDIYGPESKEFQQLMSIYSLGAANLKSYLNDENFLNKIDSLSHKNLLFFYLRLKNLDLQEKITIIIPEMNEKYNEILLKIFQFFNCAFIHEIEGEYFIIDDQDKNVKKIKNGFMIKLTLPSMQLSMLRESIIEILELMNIKSYIIFTDLVDFSFALEQFFSKDELDNYQPLNNLKWDGRSKRWKNVKLFGEGFIKKYPPLSNNFI